MLGRVERDLGRVGPGPPEDEPSGNLFAYLNLEEPSEQFLTDPMPGARSQQAVEVFEVETFDDELENQLTAYFFINDLNKYREFIHESWEMFKDLKTSLEAASIATNTALDLGKINELRT